MDVILNAGIAAITAPNANAIEIFGAKVGLDGKRPRIRVDYGDTSQNTLPAGDYVALVTAGEASTEGTFTVTAGERTDTTVTVPVGLAAISCPRCQVHSDLWRQRSGLDGKRPTSATTMPTSAKPCCRPATTSPIAEAGQGQRRDAVHRQGWRAERRHRDHPARGGHGIRPPARGASISCPQAGLDGNRDGMGGDYDERTEATLPPGDYVAVSEYDDGTHGGKPLYADRRSGAGSDADQALRPAIGRRASLDAPPGLAYLKRIAGVAQW